MKTLLFLVFLAQTAQSADYRYSCEPTTNDGDAYGSLLTIRVSKSSLKLTSEYLKKVFRGEVVSSTLTQARVRFTGLDLESDPNSFALLQASLLKGQDSGTIELTSTIEDKARFFCKKAFETIEWVDSHLDSGRVVVTHYDTENSDEASLGYAKDLKDRKACFRGNPKLVMENILLGGIDVGGDESCAAPIYRKRSDSIRVPNCQMDVDGPKYSVTLTRCEAAAL